MLDQTQGPDHQPADYAGLGHGGEEMAGSRAGQLDADGPLRRAAGGRNRLLNQRSTGMARCSERDDVAGRDSRAGWLAGAEGGS